jgi:hypothetical protein
MENFGIIYDHLVYLTSIGNILWPIGIFCGNFAIFFHRFGILDQEESGNPVQYQSKTIPLDHDNVSLMFSKNCPKISITK